MPEYRIKKNGKVYKVTTDTQQEAIDRVLAYVGEKPAAPAEPETPAPLPSAVATAEETFNRLASRAAPSIKPLESGVLATIGDYLVENRPSEMDAVQRALQSLQLGQGLGEYLQTTGTGQPTTLGQDVMAALDVFDVAGVAPGLGKGVVAGARAATDTARRAAGMVSDLEPLSMARIKSPVLPENATEALVAFDRQITERVKQSPFVDNKEQFNFVNNWGMGLTDSVRQKISPEAGAKLQVADETAMRQNTLDSQKFVETKAMRRVSNLFDTDDTFAGMMLDFSRGAESKKAIEDYIEQKIDKRLRNRALRFDSSVEAFNKYMDWSAKSNNLWNVEAGEYRGGGALSQMDMFGEPAEDWFLHTQKVRGFDKSARIEPINKLNEKDALSFEDDPYNLAVDAAAKERTRGIIKEGAKVNVREYANPFVTNANRIFNNNRVLAMKDAFGLPNVNTGADGVMSQLERNARQRGLGETSARALRNAAVTLLKGQNRAADAGWRALQSSGYSVLSGPMTAILNMHDLSVAMWNNGVKSSLGLFNPRLKSAASLERLGLTQQNVGEWFQRVRKEGAKATTAERLEMAANVFRDVTMNFGFKQLDALAKHGVVRMVAQDTLNRARRGTLRERWAGYLEPADLARLEGALRRTNGDVRKMNAKEAKLYDQILTAGLGQQQLISAGGRPMEWLQRPNLRPMWMMRGFAIKHNALLSDRIAKKLRAGDKAGAAKEATLYLALPGAAYAGLNVGRRSIFKEDYEPTEEEVMYSLADSVLGPLSLNSMSVGSQYERSLWERGDVAQIVANGLLPPLGLYGDVAGGVMKAIAKGDVEEVADIVAESPFYKQWSNFFDNID